MDVYDHLYVTCTNFASTSHYFLNAIETWTTIFANSCERIHMLFNAFVGLMAKVDICDFNEYSCLVFSKSCCKLLIIRYSHVH